MMIAINQFGTIIKLEGKHPRKELLDAVGYKHAERIYTEVDEKTFHVGYMIGGSWWELYRLEPVRRPA